MVEVGLCQDISGIKAKSVFKLTSREQNLVRKIFNAGAEKDWDLVQNYLSNYTGNISEIYAAGMNAALSCDRVVEGAAVYKMGKDMCQQMPFRNSVSILSIPTVCFFFPE